MKAIVLTDFGPVENLQLKEIPDPDINDGEVLIRVKAISINPVDAKTRIGRGQAPNVKAFDPIILGWDISGIVVDSKSQLFKIGDEVFGMVNFPGHGRGYAEYVAAPADQLALKPANVSHQEAAAATLAALTAWQGLAHHSDLKKGQRVLIHAAAGGVGHYAVQMAKYLGAYVIGTSSADNKDFVLSLGADEHFDYHSGPFEEAISNIDLVWDPIGNDNIDRSLKVMKKGGTIISLPFGANDLVAEKAAEKGTKGLRFYVASDGDDMKKIAALLEQGDMISFVSRTFAFDDIAGAHLAIESGKTKGKIIVNV
jgi:NADPH:quinone reductase-like Zn-dependent oxidoreductase